ncbi:MAG: ATP-binding protein [Candidatus Algichlamydia australiensis]|nr:ATP-binding protein [Chlamydiales bacterium]
MTHSVSQQFAAKLDQLYPMLDFVREAIAQMGFDEAAAQRFEIAVEEAVVNVIHHAYPKKEGYLELTLNLFPKKKMQVVVKDQGVPFNPLLQNPEIDRDAPIEKRQPGGLGIPFMHEFVDSIHYEREDIYNVLILEKQFQSL